MKKKEKRMILILILVAIIIVVGLLMLTKKKDNKPAEVAQQDQPEEKYVEVLEDGTKLNNSNKLHETKKIGDLEVTGIQLTHQNGISVVLANVVNTGSQDVDLTEVVLTLYDDQNNVLETLDGLISPVKAGESVQLNMGISADYANAYDFTIVKK